MSNLVALKKINGDVSVKETFELALTDKNRIPLAKANLSHVITNGSYALKNCDSLSLANAVVQMTNLGFSAQTNKAYIIPYGNKASFLIGVWGWIDLAIRSGKVKHINKDIVYEGMYKGKNFLTGEYEFNPDGKKSDVIVGYMSYLELEDGFRKTLYWTAEQIHEHFVNFSKNNYDENKRLWMESKSKNIVSKILTVEKKAQITMLKAIIQKYAPLNPMLETALLVDGATYEKNNVTTNKVVDGKVIEVKRIAADKEDIKIVYNQAIKIISDKELAKTKEEASKLINQWGKNSGINWAISSGWGGVTADELKAFCDYVEKEQQTEIIVNGKRLSQELPEAEKETEIDL